MDGDRCPVCGLAYETRCRCLLADMVCPAGHHWHTCPVHGVTVVGRADHARDWDECRCPPRRAGG